MIKYLIILVLLSDVFADISKEEFVKKINEIRLELAKREKIPNMHEMVWSEEIASRIGGMNENSEEHWQLGDYMPSYEDQIQFLHKRLPFITRFTDYETFEFLNPTQTRFGCGLNNEELKCLSKPRVGLYEKEGEPGSDCNEGFENHGGLCGRTEEEAMTAEINTTSEVSEFIEKLNEFRQEKAKRNNVSDMHEMIWSDEIASRIGGMDNNSEEYSQLKSIPSYEGQIQIFNKSLSTSSAFFFTFVFSATFQTHIGCALNDKKLKCLLKPRDGMFKKKGEPGSDCKEGFENHGGLCGLILSTTTTEETVTSEQTTTSSTEEATTTITIPEAHPKPIESEKKEEKVHPTTTTTLNTMPGEDEKKEEESENNSSSFHLFVIFVLVLWIFIE